MLDVEYLTSFTGKKPNNLGILFFIFNFAPKDIQI